MFDRDNTAFKQLMGDKTFGELHNMGVNLTSPDGQGPFQRALALQVSFAAHVAIDIDFLLLVACFG